MIRYVKQDGTQSEPQSSTEICMKAEDIVGLHTLLEENQISVWIDGGWGVDALLGEQTRPHSDVDIVIKHKDVPKLRELLEALGYEDRERDDTSAWNFVLGDNAGHEVDVHAITFDDEGNGLYGPKEKGVMYPAASLTGTGTVNGHAVKCISAEYLVKFHTGYELDENDYRDVSALCERFGIDYPHDLLQRWEPLHGADVHDLPDVVTLVRQMVHETIDLLARLQRRQHLLVRFGERAHRLVPRPVADLDRLFPVPAIHFVPGWLVARQRAQRVILPEHDMGDNLPDGMAVGLRPPGRLPGVEPGHRAVPRRIPYAVLPGFLPHPHDRFPIHGFSLHMPYIVWYNDYTGYGNP